MIALLKGVCIVTAALVLFIGGCGEKESAPVASASGGTDGGSTEPDQYTVEFEPSLSMDWEEIYFVATDAFSPDKNGIWRARIASPQREHLYAGFGFHSPVVSPDGSTVAFLSGGSVSYLNVADSSVETAGLGGAYEAILYINDSLIVACAAGTLSVINVNDSSRTQFGTGYDPTFDARNQFICVSRRMAGVWDIRRYAYRNSVEGEQFTDDTLTTLASEGIIRWVSFAPANGRYVFVEQIGGNYSVYTGELDSQERNFIATTGYAKPLMLNFNLLIYSGPDGRFYQSTFDGSFQAPFWHAVSSE